MLRLNLEPKVKTVKFVNPINPPISQLKLEPKVKCVNLFNFDK